MSMLSFEEEMSGALPDLLPRALRYRPDLGDALGLVQDTVVRAMLYKDMLYRDGYEF